MLINNTSDWIVKKSNKQKCCASVFQRCSVCLPSCIEVRAWLALCWLERRQFFSWAAADCGDEVGLTQFTSGVEGRDEEGPGEPGDAGPSASLFPTWLLPLPPPPLTGLDRQEREPLPNGALQGGEIRAAVLFVSDQNRRLSENSSGSAHPRTFPSPAPAAGETNLSATTDRLVQILPILLHQRWLEPLHDLRLRRRLKTAVCISNWIKVSRRVRCQNESN